MAKKDKNNPANNVAAAPYEQEKKRHPILNFFIILFAILLVIDAALLIFWFVQNGLPKNPNYVKGEYTLVEADIPELENLNGAVLILTWDAASETGDFRLTFNPGGLSIGGNGGTGGSNDDNTGSGDENTGNEDENTGGTEGGEGEENGGEEGGDVEATADASVAHSDKGKWTYDGGVVTFNGSMLKGAYVFKLPIFGKDTLNYDEVRGKAVFRKK